MLNGRKPRPISEIKKDNKKDRMTQNIIRHREEIENSLLSSQRLKMPKGMSRTAQQEWRRIMKLYSAMDNKFLCDLDLAALRSYCEAYAIYRKAEETWAKYEAVIASGHEAQRVLDKCRNIMNDQSRMIIALSEQLCLTPVGRARMGIAKKDEKRPSKLDEIFGDNEE